MHAVGRARAVVDAKLAALLHGVLNLSLYQPVLPGRRQKKRKRTSQASAFGHHVCWSRVP